ncbi:MAG TPA: peroxiredoxin [bacterium]|nr:peroxiredoxin [bacterium]
MRMRTWLAVLAGVALVVGAGKLLTGTARAEDRPAVTSGKASEVGISVGDVAPDFTLAGTGGTKVSLSSYKGKNHVVLIFYPMDFTSVCTKQVCQLRDDYADFTGLDAVGFGINNNPLKTHEDFRTEYKLPFALLHDPELEVALQYGAAREKGQEVLDRTVVIVGKDGKIIFYQKGVPSSADMLAAIKAAESAK